MYVVVGVVCLQSKWARGPKLVPGFYWPDYWTLFIYNAIQAQIKSSLRWQEIMWNMQGILSLSSPNSGCLLIRVVLVVTQGILSYVSELARHCITETGSTRHRHHYLLLLARLLAALGVNIFSCITHFERRLRGRGNIAFDFNNQDVSLLGTRAGT